MIVLNREKVESTKRAIKRTGSPSKRADLESELEGWENWVRMWEQRLADAQNINTEENK